MAQSRQRREPLNGGECVRGKMDVQAINRTTCRSADIYPALYTERSEIYRGATAPLTSPIDRPELPLRLTGMSTGREDECVCLRVESLKANGVFVEVFMV